MECIKCKSPLPDGAIYCPMCGKKQTQTKRKAIKRANGTGCITKYDGNRRKPWVVRKGYVYIGSYATKTDAVKALERLTDVKISDRYNLTFEEVYAAWKPEHDRTIGTAGQKSYKMAYNNCPELHGKTFRSLRRSDFQAVITRLEQEGKSKSYCEKMLQLFGQLSEWAVQEDIQQVNHAKFCSIAASQKTEGRVIPPEAIEKIKNSKLPGAKIALILLATGCRPNELFAVDAENCYDAYFIGGSKTEAGKNRVIAVSEIGLVAYQSLRTAAKGHQRLIDGYDGNKEYHNYAKRDFKRLMAEVGLEGYSPYDCRHTFITNATRAGVSPQILRRIVGHSDLSVTDKYYTHTDTEDILNELSQRRIYE